MAKKQTNDVRPLDAKHWRDRPETLVTLAEVGTAWRWKSSYLATEIGYARPLHVEVWSKGARRSDNHQRIILRFWDGRVRLLRFFPDRDCARVLEMDAKYFVGFLGDMSKSQWGLHTYASHHVRRLFQETRAPKLKMEVAFKLMGITLPEP